MMKDELNVSKVIVKILHCYKKIYFK